MNMIKETFFSRKFLSITDLTYVGGVDKRIKIAFTAIVEVLKCVLVPCEMRTEPFVIYVYI